MSGKSIALCVWTLGIIAALVLLGIKVTKDDVYTGTRIEFTTGRTIQIDADKVTFQAASSEFFVLRKTSGETIIGVPAPRPLGWSNDQYFVAGPQVVSGGQWLFPDGSATVKITNDNAVTVRLMQESTAFTWFLLSVIAICLWGLGVLAFR